MNEQTPQPVYIVDQPVAGPTGTPYAGFWIRVGAALIDAIILLIPNFIISNVFSTMMPNGAVATHPFASLLIIILYIGYYTWFQGGRWQATPGKRIVGIHVCRPDGHGITHLRAFGRYFAYILSGMLFMIGYIMTAFTREKTALHDLICDTRVVYGKR